MSPVTGVEDVRGGQEEGAGASLVAFLRELERTGCSVFDLVTWTLHRCLQVAFSDCARTKSLVSPKNGMNSSPVHTLSFRLYR